MQGDVISGFALPPMVIHRGKYHDSWHIGVLVRGSKKGYINKKLFAEYGKMLIYHLHASEQLDKPNLLLMDSHYVHVFNYCFTQMMYRQDIKVFVLEPHTSHWGQPLSACIYCLGEEQESSDGDSTSSSESEYEDYSDGQEEAFNEAVKTGKEDIVK